MSTVAVSTVTTDDGVEIAYTRVDAAPRDEPHLRVEPAETGPEPRVEPAETAAPTNRTPVLLVHGFASNADLNWETSGWVRALADAGRGSIRVDLRGHGNSGAPHEASAYTPQRLAADLIAVLDAEGLERVDVIGYSMGARLALTLEREHPERVRRLVLGGIGGREQFSTWGVDTLRAALLHGEPVDDPVAAGLIGALVGSPHVDREAVAACVEGMAGQTIEGAPNAPTLLVAGEADDVAVDAASFAERIGAAFVPVPKRTHLNAVTARGFKQAALEFLAE